MHVVWVPKYCQSVLTGEVAVRVRDVIRQIAVEHEIEIILDKVARDHIHVFVVYRPNQSVSEVVQWLKEISSRVLLQEFPYLRKKFWGGTFVGQRVFGGKFRKSYGRDDQGVHR